MLVGGLSLIYNIFYIYYSCFPPSDEDESHRYMLSHPEKHQGPILHIRRRSEEVHGEQERGQMQLYTLVHEQISAAAIGRSSIT